MLNFSLKEIIYILDISKPNIFSIKCRYNLNMFKNINGYMFTVSFSFSGLFFEKKLIGLDFLHKYRYIINAYKHFF